jgi:hypothetical protein
MEANSIAAIPQLATYNVRIFNVQLASMRRAACNKCRTQHAANMVAAMQPVTRCMSTPALILSSFSDPLALLFGDAGPLY